MRRLVAVFLVLLLGHNLQQTDGNPTSACNGTMHQASCAGSEDCSVPSVVLSVPKEAVLVLGNSGSGKSTLSKHLSHHDEDMKSVREDEQFLITGELIGSSLQSVTAIPKLMTDNATGTSYLDCPGFQDTREGCTEITTTYYMKDIFANIRRVKVLLLTPYYAVRKGQDRSDFITMLLHATRILRSVSKMRDSLALVVTKVDALMRQRGRTVPMPDDTVKKSVAAFLRNSVTPFLAEQLSAVGPEEQKEDYRRAAAIVDVLLVEEGGEYPHIGIFRAPDDEGRLNEIQVMEDGRKELLDLVDNMLRYSDVGVDDFGSSVSERTKVFAIAQSRAASDAVVGKLAFLTASMASRMALEAYDDGNIPATATRLDAAGLKARNLADGVRATPTAHAFCALLNELLQDTPERPLVEDVVANECRRLDVLQVVVADTPLVDDGVLRSQWQRPFDVAVDALWERKAWDRYLMAVYDRLSQYDAVAGHLFVGSPPVSPDTLPLFDATVAKPLGVSVSMNPSVANVSDLNVLLDILDEQIEMECVRSERALIVHGDLVLLSVAASAAQNCPFKVDSVQVYAINTVFVDEDVKLPGVDLVVIAPRWEVRGSSRIILDGRPGDPPSMSYWTKQEGAAGDPGKPGAPGGNFLGVGRLFVGEVRVSLNGGQGGDGQNGNFGWPGQSGGGHGGAGGNGGAGGFGGHHGNGELINLGGYVRSSVVGVDGSRGQGGLGGRGGDHRPHSLRRRKRFVITGAVLGALAIAGAIGGAVYVAKRKPPPPPPPMYYDGPRGADGAATFGRIPAQPPRAARWEAVPSRMMRYFELNMKNPYLKDSTKEFLQLVDQSQAFQRRTRPQQLYF